MFHAVGFFVLASGILAFSGLFKCLKCVLNVGAAGAHMKGVLMPKTTDLKLRIDPELKRAAGEVYRQWGLNLTDAVTIFLYQSVAEGGMPFAMKRPQSTPAFNWDNPNIIRIDSEAGHAVLPADWDSAEDAIYDKL